MLKPYDGYKETNIQWLEEVPSHWGISRNKNIFKEINYKNPSETGNLLSVSQYTGVTEKKNNTTKTGMYSAESLIGYKFVSKDELVMNIMLAWNGSLGVSKFDGVVSPAYAVFKPIRSINPMYFHYLFRSPCLTNYFKSFSTGVVQSRLRLYPETFFLLFSTVPPRAEQDQIVKYLDWQTSKINTFIKAKKKQIELLKEQKQAVINQAVTKGLDDTVPMKDSGVEWLGEVPEHYQICKLKNLGTFKSGLNLTSLDINHSGIYPVYGGNGLRGYFSEFTHSGEYLLIGRQGALCGNVHFVCGDFWATEHAITVQPTLISNIKWLYYLVMVMNLNQYSTAAAQPGISVEKIIALYTIFPSLKEQQAIVTYLEEKTALIDKAIAVMEKEIELVSEYKTSLISAVVTGKVDVRDVVVPDFEVVEEVGENTENEEEEMEE